MQPLDELPVRDDLRGQQPYGAPQIDVPIRLNTNENPFAPPSGVSKAIGDSVQAAALNLNRYPDREATELRAALAGYVSSVSGPPVDWSGVWPANGSNEVLQQLLQAFGGTGRSALGFEPTYSMHRLICRGTGTHYHVAPRAPDFTIDEAAAVAAVRRHSPDVVFLCSPNNPTGNAVAVETVKAVYEAARGIVVVDEAYGEFSNRPSALSLLPGRTRLVVVRTMSKAFALAGARVGYAVGDPALVAALQLVRLPYHLSTITQAVALVALDRAPELLANVGVLRAQRDRIAAELGRLGYRILGSDGNFVFFEVGNERQVWQELLSHGVLVRDVGLPGYLRVTAGTPEETTEFLAVMQRITKESAS